MTVILSIHCLLISDNLQLLDPRNMIILKLKHGIKNYPTISSDLGTQSDLKVKT